VLGRHADELRVLFHADGGRLARGTHGHDGTGARFDVPVEQIAVCVEVERAIRLHRRNDRDQTAFDHHDGISRWWGEDKAESERSAPAHTAAPRHGTRTVQDGSSPGRNARKTVPPILAQRPAGVGRIVKIAIRACHGLIRP
jgi:hypothetical protein